MHNIRIFVAKLETKTKQHQNMVLYLKCLFKALVCPKSKGLSKWEIFGDQTFYRLATLFSTV